MSVRTLLRALHEGQMVVVATTTNQYGESIAVEELSYQDGAWYQDQLNCWSSQDLGMGTCRCVSHPTRGHLPIPRRAVLSALQTLARNERQDTAGRAAETAWLERAIADCPE